MMGWGGLNGGRGFPHTDICNLPFRIDGRKSQLARVDPPEMVEIKGPLSPKSGPNVLLSPPRFLTPRAHDCSAGLSVGSRLAVAVLG